MHEVVCDFNPRIRHRNGSDFVWSEGMLKAPGHCSGWLVPAMAASESGKSDDTVVRLHRGVVDDVAYDEGHPARLCWLRAVIDAQMRRGRFRKHRAAGEPLRYGVHPLHDRVVPQRYARVFASSRVARGGR